MNSPSDKDMNAVELCPCCASKPRLMEGRGDWDRLDTRPRPNVHWVHCWTCGLRSGEHETAHKAAAAWNTRATLTDQPTAEVTDAVASVRQLIVDACSLIDTIKVEWLQSGHWSEWDQSVRDRATSSINLLDAMLTISPLQTERSTDMDAWNPRNEDPYWMLEAEDGEWLKNEHTLSGTRDAAKALRFPTKQECYNHPARMTTGCKWWSAKPTEHLWIAPTRQGDEALVEALERVRGLWALLDDIDTLDDACRSDDVAFRKTAREVQQKRFAILSGEQWDALAKHSQKAGS